MMTTRMIILKIMMIMINCDYKGNTNKNVTDINNGDYDNTTIAINHNYNNGNGGGDNYNNR